MRVLYSSHWGQGLRAGEVRQEEENLMDIKNSPGDVKSSTANTVNSSVMTTYGDTWIPGFQRIPYKLYQCVRTMLDP